jgi:hypothetical protein
MDTADIQISSVTKDDLKRLNKMARLAKQFATLHHQLSSGCNWVAFAMHSENSSVNHIAAVIENATHELATKVTEAFKPKSPKYVFISGYYKDDSSEFCGVRCAIGLDFLDNDDDIFFYFEDEEILGEHSDFVVTSFTC